MALLRAKVVSPLPEAERFFFWLAETAVATLLVLTPVVVADELTSLMQT